MLVLLVLFASFIFAIPISHMLIAQPEDQAYRPTSTPRNNSFTTYKNTNFGISIDYPSDWWLNNLTSTESTIKNMENIEKDNQDSLPLSSSEYSSVASDLELETIGDN